MLVRRTCVLSREEEEGMELISSLFAGSRQAHPHRRYCKSHLVRRLMGILQGRGATKT